MPLEGSTRWRCYGLLCGLVVNTWERGNLLVRVDGRKLLIISAFAPFNGKIVVFLLWKIGFMLPEISSLLTFRIKGWVPILFSLHVITRVPWEE